MSELKDKLIQIMVTQKEKDAFVSASEKEHPTLSEWIRRTLREKTEKRN